MRSTTPSARLDQRETGRRSRPLGSLGRPLTLGAALLAGCGGGSTHVTLSSQDAAALSAQLGSARIAAARHDPAAASDALRAFRTRVAQLRSAGRITPATAQALLTGSLQAEARVAVDVRPVAPAMPTQPSAVPAPPSGAGASDHHKGRGKGNGKGGGGDGGD